jgi:hypothetical protein
MTNRIPRKSAARIATGIAVALGIYLAASLVWDRLSATDVRTPDSWQLNQYSSLAYSGEDVWHALPIGR